MFPTATDEMSNTMQRPVTEMSKMLQQFTATVMNLQPKNQPLEAAASRQQHMQRSMSSRRLSPRRERSRGMRLRVRLVTHAAASKLRRQEGELQELRQMLQLAHNEITAVQSRLERLERPPPGPIRKPIRHTASSAKKAAHPRYGGRPAPEMSPVFTPTTPG